VSITQGTFRVTRNAIDSVFGVVPAIARLKVGEFVMAVSVSLV